MYLSAIMQNDVRIIHSVICRMYHSGPILDGFSKLQNVIKNFDSAFCRTHRPQSRVRHLTQHDPQQEQYKISYLVTLSMDDTYNFFLEM